MARACGPMYCYDPDIDDVCRALTELRNRGDSYPAYVRREIINSLILRLERTDGRLMVERHHQHYLFERALNGHF